MAVSNAQTRDGFWTLLSWGSALAVGIVFAVVIGALVGAGLGAGLFFGAIIFVLLGWFLAHYAVGPALPAPGSVKAPTVPRSTTRAPAAAAGKPPVDDGTLDGKLSVASHHAGEAMRAVSDAVGKAAAGVSETVSRAATGASEAVSQTVARVSDAAPVAPVPETVGLMTDVPAERPKSLKAARKGEPDDLKKIKGVGPKLEELLHSLGFYHFDQVAAWTPAEVAWVDSNLEGFNGRATRDDWVGQAKLLAAGGETEFSKRVDKGDVY